MSNSPYENEPGYENAKGAEAKKMNDLYCAKVRLSSRHGGCLGETDCR